MSKRNLDSRRLRCSQITHSQRRESTSCGAARGMPSRAAARTPRKRRSPIRASLPAAIERAIEEARKAQIALIRPSIDFAFSCLEGAKLARDPAAARIGLQHARAGYELARRVLSKNSRGIASASLGDELTALRHDLEKAEEWQTMKSRPSVTALRSRELQNELTSR